MDKFIFARMKGESLRRILNKYFETLTAIGIFQMNKTNSWFVNISGNHHVNALFATAALFFGVMVFRRKLARIKKGFVEFREKLARIKAVVWVWWRKCKREITVTNRCSITVLCPDNTAQVNTAFKDFAEYQLDYDVIFESDWTDSGKYFLLCDAVSRIPEDVERALNVLDIKGDGWEKNTMIVAMHSSEIGRQDILPSHGLNLEIHVPMTNIFYCKNFTFHCSQNDKARNEIYNFFSPQNNKTV